MKKAVNKYIELWNYFEEGKIKMVEFFNRAEEINSITRKIKVDYEILHQKSNIDDLEVALYL